MSETKGETTYELIRLLCASAYAAYSSSISGRSQWLHDRFEWFKNPQPGDLVMEISSAFMNDGENRIGYLIRVGMEPMFTDEKWEEDKEDWENDRPQEKIWRIRLLANGEECRWENADFIRVPRSTREFADIGRASQGKCGDHCDKPMGHAGMHGAE